MLAIKYNEDDYYSNKYYAKVGGINLDELNSLEYNFLILLDFDVFIDEETYEKYKEKLKDFYEKIYQKIEIIRYLKKCKY